MAAERLVTRTSGMPWQEFSGSSAERSALATGQLYVGDLYHQDDGKGYRWDGSAWQIYRYTTSGATVTTEAGKNVELLAAETLTWNGVLTTQNTADIDVPSGREVLVNINNESNEELTVTFFHKIGTDYVQYYGADGEALSFTIAATTHLVFGPIQGFPRYAAGRITVTAGAAPTDTTETIIQVQEV